MAEQEKTALEVILELPSILKKIENKIDVLDTNLKILNSKINKIKLEHQTESSNISQNSSSEKTESEEFMAKPMATPGGVERPQSQNNSPKEPVKLTIGSIKVFSRVKTSTGKPVDGMTINIFDKSNDLVRNLITDKDGYWECKLPHGKYSIEMIHPKIKTINKEFELLKDIKSYEVT
jgi:hypothetical protein